MDKNTKQVVAHGNLGFKKNTSIENTHTQENVCAIDIHKVANLGIR